MESSSTEHSFGIPYRSGEEIRTAFYKFFESKQHIYVPSSSVAQHDDPTLLFTNAGMNQFKAAFLGDNRKSWKRVYNSQKCMRVSGKHNDLDEVGSDGTHHTFFEMLGNWSFGDYGKKQAIEWAWEFLTEILELPKDRLFATIHKDDQEAGELWLKHTDIEPWRVLPFEAENFWEMGAIGPCGFSSEIFFDLGEPSSQQSTYSDQDRGVNGENPRYVEVWNLVFMQYERLKDRSLKPLPALNVDTGSGLERLTMVVQGKQSNYDTDLFSSTVKQIEQITGVQYPGNGPEGKPFRVICDHLRALSFAISDGVMPANEGRGYVMRRILRRACRYGHKLGQKSAFIYQLVAGLVERMKSAYPDLGSREDTIRETIRLEEERFLKTLDQGLSRFERLAEEASRSGTKQIPGEQAFLLHDTYGFPFDLTQLLAQEKSLTVDEKGFEGCMNEQRTRARASSKFDHRFTSEESWVILNPQKSTEFVGYTADRVDSVKTLRYLLDDQGVYFVFDKTPFYAEAGGQIGDSGWLTLADGSEVEVVETKTAVGLHLHRVQGQLEGLSSAQLACVSLRIDSAKRQRIRCNHSATHLLHSALRAVLGDHVEQQGSSVDDQRIRFDFTSHAALNPEQILACEDFVNRAIWGNHPVETNLMSLEDAKSSGAMALFGEKYSETVRVLKMGSVSTELCGGTHAGSTGEIGMLKIISEGSIASGVRRVEAITGQVAVDAGRVKDKTLADLAGRVKARPDQLAAKIDKLILDLKESSHQLKRAKAVERSRYLLDLVSRADKHPSGARVLVTELDAGLLDAKDLQSFLDQCAEQFQDGVACLAHVEGDNVSILATVGKSFQKSLPAGQLVKDVAAVAGGRGGGRADKARGGAKDPSKVLQQLEHARHLVSEKLC